jgi:type II secretory pathway pseudopilin PulG
VQADHRHGHCLSSSSTIFSTPCSRARESLCGDSATAGFTIFEAVLVILIILVLVASLIPRVSTTLAHSKVNRAAYVIAADFLLAQSLAARQHTPVVIAVSSTALTVTISQPSPSTTVLRTDYFDKTSEFQLSALSATPASAQVMPNAMATASMVVTVGGADYYHLVRMTQAGQVRITK